MESKIGWEKSLEKKIKDYIQCHWIAKAPIRSLFDKILVAFHQAREQF